MKMFKRIGSVLLAVMMTVAMCCPAFAAETYTITINNEAPNHTYEAYQIFTGDLSGDKLSNIKWGNGISEAGKAALGDAAAKAEKVADAAAFAKEVAPYLENPTASGAQADKKYTISGLAAGYYLVKDQDDSLAEQDDSYTAYIMKVVKNVEAAPKGDKPSVQKKVKDINDTTDAAAGAWQDSADHDIGDDIDFQLTGTVANNYDLYETYKFIFHDQESEGLTFNAGSVKVYVDGVQITDNYTVNANPDDGDTFDVEFANLKDIDAVHAGSKITVEYTAKLNENAVIGATGNPNEVYLEYSNNPNSDQGGDKDTGKTPNDKVIVFTYKVTVNKVNPQNQPLAGAEFTLFKKMQDGSEKEIATSTVVDATTTSFDFKGLDDGQYILRETKTPAGYNSINPITFEIKATHDVDSADPQLTELSGNKVTGEIEFTANKDAGSLSTNIVNKSGSELPETGGIGTTLFYVFGTVFMVGAGVMLVSKKRMNH